MKNSNFSLAFLFLLIPFLCIAQKNVGSVLHQVPSGGGDPDDEPAGPPVYEPGESQSITVTVKLNDVTGNGEALTLPAEGEPYAEPTYLLLEEKVTGELISSILLNGQTFYPTNGGYCSTVNKWFNFSFNLNDCPAELPADGIFLDEYVVRLSNADSYENPTNFYLSNSHYVRSLIGMNPNNPNVCVFYERLYISYDIFCGTPIGTNFTGNGKTNNSEERYNDFQTGKSSAGLTASVSPNPFSESIKIDNLLSNESVTIKVFDSSGRIMKSISLTGIESREQVISTLDWSPGFYLVRIETKSENQTFKLLKF